MEPQAIYIFAGGGTGGHLYPGLAVAEELTRLTPEARIVFACSNRDIDRRILDPLPYAIVPQPIRPFPRSIPRMPGFLRSWFRSARQARDMVRDLRPTAVLGLGGFAAAPLVKRARQAGVRTGFLNPDAVPGLANRYLARYSDAIFAQFASTAEAFAPKHRNRVRHVGCPIRASLPAASKEEAVGRLELQPGRRTLLVFGASLGAASINDALTMLAPRLAAEAPDWQVVHVTGPQKLSAVAQAYRQAGVPARVVEYCDRMDWAYAAADLVVCRSGASTVAELAATASPAILLPYPYHRDQHQKLNAREYVAAGAGLLCEDTKDAAANAATLARQMLPLLKDFAALDRMRTAARGLGLSDAARTIAQWMVGKTETCKLIVEK